MDKSNNKEDLFQCNFKNCGLKRKSEFSKEQFSNVGAGIRRCKKCISKDSKNYKNQYTVNNEELPSFESKVYNISEKCYCHFDELKNDFKFMDNFNIKVNYIFLALEPSYCIPMHLLKNI